jgi:hypothetical protein
MPCWRSSSLEANLDAHVAVGEDDERTFTEEVPSRSLGCVETVNIASIRCLAKAGFRLWSPNWTSGECCTTHASESASR